ncbi:MAG: hypothetical protein K2P45_06070 [Eubacterium sp.]|nr:hypothetical protein [Eubacterium sp.]
MQDTIRERQKEEGWYGKDGSDWGAGFYHLGLLLASGYLKVLQVVKSRRGKAEYELALTNQEARFIFDEMVTGWFSNIF